MSCAVVFYHPVKNISLVVHGDGFTFCRSDRDLKWVRDHMKSWYEIKVRARLGMDKTDDKEVSILSWGG